MTVVIVIIIIRIIILNNNKNNNKIKNSQLQSNLCTERITISKKEGERRLIDIQI